LGGRIMKTDIEIAQQAKLEKIQKIAKKIKYPRRCSGTIWTL